MSDLISDARLGAALVLANAEGRMPIIIEHNDEITQICSAIYVGATRLSPDDFARSLKSLGETLFCLGYKAGQEHIEVGDVWKNGL